MEFLESVGAFAVTLLLAASLGSIVGTLITQALSFLDEQVRKRIMIGVTSVIGLLSFIWLVGGTTDAVIASSEGSKVADTVWGVSIALVASASLFIMFNLLFNEVTSSYRRFSTGLGAVLGFGLFGLLDGNRLIQWFGPREALATNVHDFVNNGEWTLLIFSLLIALTIGSLVGLTVGTYRERLTDTLKITVGASLYLGAIWGLFYAERIPVDTTLRLLWTPLFGAILVGAIGNGLSRLDQPLRLYAGSAAGAIVGLLIAGLLKSLYLPRISLIPLAGGALCLGLVGAGLSKLRGRRPVGGALLGTALGWVIGTYVVTKTGGPRIESMINTAIPLALIGARMTWRPRPGVVEAATIDIRSRAWIFLSPALTFIFLGLLVPLVRTMYLSTLSTHRDSETRVKITEFVGLANYKDILTDTNSFNLSNWSNIFTSAPFQIGAVLVLFGLAVAVRLGRQSGNSFKGAGIAAIFTSLVLLAGAAFEMKLLGNATDDAPVASWHYVYLLLFAAGGIGIAAYAVRALAAGSNGASSTGLTFDLGGGHLGAIVFGLFLIGMATFASLRGTLLNSLWWVFAVTIISSALGLAIAALADRAGFENLAKSIIFMPMAISFVGAGIIWRFMYIARPDEDVQTGVMNYVWLKLGDMSMGSGSGRTLSLLVLGTILVSLVALGIVSFRNAASGLGTGVLLLAGFVGLLFWRILDHRLGGTGVQVTETIVQGRTIPFLSKGQPYNNLWLMVVLIWIQTGFAMVIFSAAIKAVPTEFVEAAKVDGATDSSIFWRIIVPQIVPTVGVVVTTLIVTVLKVFDVVKVMTNGNFDSQVIANEMWFQAFTVGDKGIGSALAVILFGSVVPVVYFNIKRIQQGA